MYFFDFGSATCLWSANDAALERFGYPVDLPTLPLPTTIRRRAEFVLAWWNTFLDWENAPETTAWADREEEAFSAAAQELLVLMSEHLGADYDLVDESRTAPSV